MALRSAASWRALSPGYRARLVRADIDRAGYLSGVNLQAARGKPAAEHVVRVERGTARGLTRSQAVGRPRPGEPSAREIRREFFGVPVRDAGGTRLVDVVTRNLAQASRLGSYMNQVGELRLGVLTAAEFEARWRHRQVAGLSVEWRADRVIEVMRQQGPEPGAQRYRRIVPGAVS